MAYPIEDKLVVGISSNALFDLRLEDEIFKKQGLNAYRQHQKENKDLILNPGVAFPFIKRFLDINTIYTEEQPIEVVLLSRNSPETGVRIFNSIKEHNLNITRCAFMSGSSAARYIPAFNISLFLSTNENDVKEALSLNFPAGRIIQNDLTLKDDSEELRIAFDFDGVIADDEAEKVYKEKGIEEYRKYEQEMKYTPLHAGPLGDFFLKLSSLQKLENLKLQTNKEYKKILKTAIVTARNAPAHERAINTLNNWGVEVDEMFLLGGISKSRVLEIMKPHLYLDDQLIHLDSSSMKDIPLVHIPFGVANK